MKTINMFKYGKPHPADKNVVFYLTAAEGKQAAQDCRLKDAVLAGTVNIDICDRGQIILRDHQQVKPEWVSGFFGGVAREVGIELFMERVSINDNSLSENMYSCGTSVYTMARKYLLAAMNRMYKSKKEKARQTGQTQWTEINQIFIPDIGTVIQLATDWTFRLYYENRNFKFLESLGKKFSRYWRDQDETKYVEVMIKERSELTVDRIYIRKGSGEFSSITFYLKKGSDVVVDGKTIKTQGRFWAKLSDVNKMMSKMDMSTLSQN